MAPERHAAASAEPRSGAAPGRPLQGRRVAITRPREQAPALADRLRALGAEVLACPTIAIAPLEDFAALDAALARLAEYDWLILTSANGARAVLRRLAELAGAASAPWPLAPGARRPRLAAIGPATAAELERHGLRADFVPSTYVAEAIVDEIGDVAGQRLLLARADIARPALAAGLRARGARVDEVTAYRTLSGSLAEPFVQSLLSGELDAVTFTSSSTVRGLLAGLEAAGVDRAEARALLARAAVVCIGPITATTARDEGLRVDAVARQYTAEGLVEALVEWFARSAGTPGSKTDEPRAGD